MGIEANNMNKDEKIEKVLQTFLQPDFKIRNDVYLNLFLRHLVGLNDDGKSLENGTNEQLKEHFCQWIIEASTLWDQKIVNPQATILAFALNLASRLSVDEQIFVKLNCKNVYESLVGVAQTNPLNDPTVTLSQVTLLCSFLEHKSGLQWVMATTHWTYVISLSLKANTMNIRKEAYQFVIKLLEKTISFNKNFAINIVGIITKPLRDVLRSVPSKNINHTQIESNELYESLKLTLDFILGVIDPLLRSANKKVFHLFLELETPKAVSKLILLSQNEDFSYKLLKIQYVFLFYNLTGKVFGVKAIAHDSLSLFDFKIMDDLLKNEMEKSHVRCIIKLCDYAHELFCCLAPNMPIFKKQEYNIEIQMQMIFVQMTPIEALSMQIIDDETAISLFFNDGFRVDFAQRWIKRSVFQSLDMCYKWCEKLKLKPDLIDDAIFCLQYVTKMKKLLNKDRASIVFAVLAYSLCDALLCSKKTPHVLTYSWELFFKTLIDTIVDFVESFDLTWKDSVETICVMDYAYDLLQYPHWTYNAVIITGLKLLNTAISKYMSPDMVLLIDHNEDSKVAQTGSLLYAKCHDSCSEIRDSALEVVYTLSENANTKFPAYTNILLNTDIPQLVVNMAFMDGEYYVRATAFRCLQELIQIPEVWNIISDMDRFLDNLLCVFENETEGIVRKEAATLIYKIDKFQGFSEDMLPRLCDVMTHATIGDLHWEVKYNALDFWFNLWEEHLVYQGMLDRMFPSHTFSQEHKKIVALNEAEVRKRIIKVMNQLAHIGCLHVMRCAVRDDCDIKVANKATSFTLTMLKMFKTYRIPCDNVDLSQPPSHMIQENGFPNRPLSEPITSVSSGSAFGPSPTSIENLPSPEFSNSPFFDPVSPLSAPYSPSLDKCVITSLEATSQSGSQSSTTLQNQSSTRTCGYQQACTQLDTQVSNVYQQTPLVSNVYQQTSPVTTDYQQISTQYTSSVNNVSQQPSPNLTSYSDLSGSNSPSNQITAGLTLDSVIDMFEYDGDISESMVSNNTTQMKTKTYLAPSQYLKFVYNEAQTHAMKKVQCMNSLDEFDALLDNILKEYNIVEDINSMDCY